MTVQRWPHQFDHIRSVGVGGVRGSKGDNWKELVRGERSYIMIKAKGTEKCHAAVS